jgi:hypothetical protein
MRGICWAADWLSASLPAPQTSLSSVMLFLFKRHLQSLADLWPTLMGFSIYI